MCKTGIITSVGCGWIRESWVVRLHTSIIIREPTKIKMMPTRAEDGCSIVLNKWVCRQNKYIPVARSVKWERWSIAWAALGMASRICNRLCCKQKKDALFSMRWSTTTFPMIIAWYSLIRYRSQLCLRYRGVTTNWDVEWSYVRLSKFVKIASNNMAGLSTYLRICTCNYQ